MKIIVDGDACPGISIIESVAKENGIDLIVYCDFNHYILLDYGTVKLVDSGFQSVDMYIMNNCKSGDIIISQDYGVAAICLAKKAKVINTKGYFYTEENIDRMLEERHIAQKIRMAGGRVSNHKKRNKIDDERLEKSLRKAIACNIRM